MESSHTICDSGISDLNCEEEPIAEPVKKKRTQSRKVYNRSSRANSERNSPIPQLSTGSDSSRSNGFYFIMSLSFHFQIQVAWTRVIRSELEMT